jgi:cytosine deaminase
MYTTLSPCDMCTGACVFYRVKRVVVGENKTFMGGEDYLRQRGVEVVVLENEECRRLMEGFIVEKPELWYVFPFCLSWFAQIFPVFHWCVCIF